MSRSGLVAVAAALLLALGAGVWLWQQRGGVATEPVPTTPTPTVVPARVPPGSYGGLLDRSVIYLARELLPPYAFHVDAADAGATPEERIRSRLEALKRVPAVGPGAPGQPGGLVNPAAQAKARLASVRVQGDLVTLDHAVPGGDWGVSGSAALRAFMQQLVYTASEEPGIRRVLITQDGGRQAIIGGEGLLVVRPVTREDVAGYEAKADTELRSDGAQPQGRVTATTRYSVDEVAPGLARFVVELSQGAGELPPFVATIRQNDERQNPSGAKWTLSLEVRGVQQPPTPGQAPHDMLIPIDGTPLRAVHSFPVFLGDPAAGMRYDLALDDLRPWRVGLLPNPTRILVDVGGHPLAVAANTAVYGPRPGDTVDRTFTVTGLARAFEANVPWRIRDDRGEILARGFTTASIGTSAVWGTYSFGVALPPSTSRNFHLEVFQVSAKDGSETEVVRVPLRLRQQ